MSGNTNDNGMRVFAGRSNPQLLGLVCDYLDISQGRVSLESFPDGESFLSVHDDVRGKDCYIIQSTCPPVNDHLMELLIFIDCLRRASAKRITAVIPYFGYARQDRKTEGRTPITAKLVANLITAAGAHRVLTMNLHADQIQGFFDIPVDHLSSTPVIVEHVQSLALDMERCVVVSPDVGNIKTANEFAERLGGDLAVIDKRRMSGSRAEARAIIGNVQNKDVLMFDDMITTAGTICEAAKLVKAHGARNIYIGVTHPVLVDKAFSRLETCDIKELCVTDTIPLRPEVRERIPYIKTLTVSKLLAEAIKRIHRNESVSALFSNKMRF